MGIWLGHDILDVPLQGTTSPALKHVILYRHLTKLHIWYLYREQCTVMDTFYYICINMYIKVDIL